VTLCWSSCAVVFCKKSALSGVLNLARQAHLELGQPMLLEVARYLSGPAADTATDPAFAAYHALLQFGCVAEQLQELGAVSAAGMAVPVGAMTWALQQGKLAAPGLPATAPPARYYYSRAGCTLTSALFTAVAEQGHPSLRLGPQALA
jgi:hypothetical protein